MHTTPSAAAPAPVARTGWRDPRRWLAIYAIALAAVAFWPVPVDSGMGGLLAAISAAVPWLSYAVIEVTANVVLFVPLGTLLAMVLPRRRWLVVPIAAVVTVLIELAQAIFLAQRTPSLRDILANTLGAVIGLAIVVVSERRSRQRA